MKRKSLFNVIAISAFFLLATSFIYFNYIKRTKGFCVQKILSRHSYNSNWDVGSPTQKQLTLLSHLSTQTFHLLGSGKDTYAFVSANGQYVIKFFKQKHMNCHSFLDLLPLPRQFRLIRNEICNRHCYLRKKMYSSFVLTYAQLQKETGILFLHLNKTNYIKKKFRFLDQHDELIHLNMDTMEFLIQRRARPLFSTIDNMMKERDFGGAKRTIDQILLHVTDLSLRGIGSADIDCRKNLGYFEGRVIAIDLGDFHPIVPRPPSKKEYFLATTDLEEYLDSTYPSLSTYLSRRREHIAKTQNLRNY